MSHPVVPTFSNSDARRAGATAFARVDLCPRTVDVVIYNFGWLLVLLSSCTFIAGGVLRILQRTVENYEPQRLLMRGPLWQLSHTGCDTADITQAKTQEG